MSLAIAGMGWVTPLGSGVDSVWDQLLHGHEASATTVSEQFADRSYSVFRVPQSAMAGFAHPRLRRASVISRFAAAAGLDALRAAGVEAGSNGERTALIFAISNGGVIYTKRFYSNIVESGAQSASPLLFPETVFNAPASHLAAILGITGATYTLVGDGAVGLAAIKMAKDLMMANEALDYCLVVGTEEVDWLLCDAYRRWRLLRLAPPIEPFGEQRRGMILSEGAGAILLARAGPFTIECAHPGGCFTKRAEAGKILKQILSDLKDAQIDLIISGANGTFVDQAESEAVGQIVPDAHVYTAKPALGESVGAAGLWQVILAAQALRTAELPPVLHAQPTVTLRLSLSRTTMSGVHRAIVLSCGLNQQAAGLRLAIQR